MERKTEAYFKNSFYHVYETLLDAVECRPQSTANQPQSGWFILQQRDTNNTHSQGDGPSLLFYDTHTLWKVIHTFTQMQLLQLEHQAHTHAERILMNSLSRLIIQRNHHNTKSFAQIMETVCVCVHGLMQWCVICQTKTDRSLIVNIMPITTGTCRGKLWGNLWGAMQTMFKKNHLQNTENQTQTGSKVNLLFFACQMEMFSPQDLFH